MIELVEPQSGQEAILRARRLAYKFQHHPNAVPDRGIDLRPTRKVPEPEIAPECTVPATSVVIKPQLPLPPDVIKATLEYLLDIHSGMKMSQTVIDYIADTPQLTGRELLAVFGMAFGRWTSNRASPTNALVDISLRSLRGYPQHRRLQHIAGLVCRSRPKLNWQVLISRKRTFDVLIPRQIVMYIACTVLRMGYAEVGRGMARDHATAMHAVKQIEKRMVTDESLRAEVEALTRAVGEQQVAPHP